MRILLLIATMFLTSCSVMDPIKSSPMQTYTLTAPYTKYQTRHRKNITLMVSMPTASSGYQTKKMIYNKKPFELSAFTKNQWAGPPAEMITPLLLQHIRNTGYFRAIIQPPISARRNLRLKVNLIELRQDFTIRPSRVNMAIQADLIDEKNNRILNSKVFTTSYFAPCDTPYGGVIAANHAAHDLLSQIANDCVYSAAGETPKQERHRRNNISQMNKVRLPKPNLKIG